MCDLCHAVVHAIYKSGITFIKGYRVVSKGYAQRPGVETVIHIRFVNKSLTSTLLPIGTCTMKLARALKTKAHLVA
jgi:hypothetical protein